MHHVRAARRHIYRLRKVSPENNPYASTPDAFAAGPVMTNLAHAIADVLEFYVDLEGGVDGLNSTRELLTLAIGELPSPCACDECITCNDRTPPWALGNWHVCQACSSAPSPAPGGDPTAA